MKVATGILCRTAWRAG